mmetsp:Transcript_59801/g.110691  ORF Transcript_59801/g.110691 Transcript_59801/m.110691 type:complete len:334 (+) Transcript_59801:91-1092(+)
MVAHLELCLLLLQLRLAFTENGNILRRQQQERMTSRSAAAEHLLGTRAEELAEALRSEYGDFSTPGAVADVIRGRLAQEASDLASEGADGASLFSAFSQRAPIEVLIVPQHTFGGLLLRPYRKSLSDSRLGLAMDDGMEDTRVVGSTVSSESIMQSDEKGNMVVQTRRCKDGECTHSSKEISGNLAGADAQHSQTNVLVDDNALRNNASMEALNAPAQETQEDTFMGIDDASSSVTDAVRRMAQDMQQIHDSFGERALSSMFDNVFSQSNEVRNRSNMVGRSYSERTVVNNGHVMREIKRCENGQCSTEREEASESRPAAPEHTEQKKPTMPF